MSDREVYKKRYTYNEVLCLLIAQHPCVVEYISSVHQHASVCE